MERNAGLKDHSLALTDTLFWFSSRIRLLGLKPLISMRLFIAPTRIRVADICVVRLPLPDEQVFSTPPYLCIEVVSPEDGFMYLQERFDDYLHMGVENIWVLDPPSRRGWTITEQGHFEALDGILKTRDGAVAMPIADLYAED